MGALLLALCFIVLGPAGAEAASRVAADFNGDGADDLAIGVIGEDVSSVTAAGAVSVIYGADGSGLSSAGNQKWSQQSMGIADAAEMYDKFGRSLIAGDFNGDDVDDLAVAAPGENVQATPNAGNAGAVNVIYGSPTGLTAAGNQFWTQNSADIADAAEDFDQFGWSLGSGDFDGDGADDLAVGTREESVGSVAGAGAVNVIYGNAGAGLHSADNQIWDQDSDGIEDTAEPFDRFGRTVSAGDFDGDGDDDLIAGAPLEDVGSVEDAGAVNAIYGVPGAGLDSAENQIWHQDSAGIADAAEGDDLFGDTLATGRFDDDGTADLAVGAHFEDVGTAVDAGSVNVLQGSPGGLVSAGNQHWHQDSSGITDLAEASDLFSYSLSAGDFDADGRDDLAVGVPDESVRTVASAGVANVIYGAAAGLVSAGNQRWSHRSPGIVDSAEAGDRFGAALSSGDLDNENGDDLAIGIPDESVASVASAGAVSVIYAALAEGLAAPGNQKWTQESPGIVDSAAASDHFGAALTGSR